MNKMLVWCYSECIWPHRAGLKNMPGPGGNQTYDYFHDADISSYKLTDFESSKGFLHQWTRFWKVEIFFVKGKPDIVIEEDEEFKKVSFDKFSQLKPVFQREGGSLSNYEKYQNTNVFYSINGLV